MRKLVLMFFFDYLLVFMSESFCIDSSNFCLSQTCSSSSSFSATCFHFRADDEVNRVIWDPWDGLLYSCSDDGTLKVWGVNGASGSLVDPSTGAALPPLWQDAVPCITLAHCRVAAQQQQQQSHSTSYATAPAPAAASSSSVKVTCVEAL